VRTNLPRLPGRSAPAAAIVLPFVLALLLPSPILAQGSVKDVLAEAKEAISAERYDLALEALKKGKDRFPGSPDILRSLGDLYYDKELYSLALKEYREAEPFEPGNASLLDKLAVTYGHLNQEKTAAEYYERIHALYPNDKDAVTDLAWMYFKTHQLEKGEKLLLEAIGKFGMNRRFAMTLGTIYADLYDYERARKYYRTSIEAALKDKEFRFASVAYYNLSLLEKSFYKYNSAMDATNRALFYEDRAPGHLAKGELHESSMDFARAHDEYRKADLQDSTPLARINLAVLYQRFGLLDEALAYAKRILEKKDYSWMFYFGTNRDRFLMDLHKLLADTYRGLMNLEGMRPEPAVAAKLASAARSIGYRILSRYHLFQYRRYADVVGRNYLEKRNFLNAWFTLSLANRDFPDTALRYLAKAKEIETAITPEAARFYLLEEGKIRRDPDLIEKAMKEFVVPWEKENIEESLRHLVPELARAGRERDRREALLRLYEINPGALRQNGFRLPVRLATAGLAETKERLEAYLEEAGFERPGEGTEAGLPLLSVKVSDSGSVTWTLEGGSLARNHAARERIELAGTGRKELAECAEKIAMDVFGVRTSPR